MIDASTNPVFDAAMAYQRTAALVAAVKLDLFTRIGSDTISADDLAGRTGASARGLRMLCDFLTVMDLLKKTDFSYALAPCAKVFLDRTSPFAMGSVVDFVAAPEMIELFLADDPASYVRRGGSNGLSNIAPDHPVWVRFARGMVPLAATTAKRVAAFVATFPNPPKRVLDVAAGHGLYGIEVAKAIPGSTITALDWEAVLTVAQEHAQAAGVEDRFRAVAGNAITLEWGSGFDLILLPNFLHHFDIPTCTALLRKAASSMSAEGICLGVDFVPNQDRISPSVPAMFAFWMLATTPGGDAYTARELDEMARRAGFRGATTRPLPPTPESLIIFER